MNKWKRISYVFALIAGVFLFSANAHAVLLDGKNLRIRYLYPNITTDFAPPKDVVVGAGVEANFGFGTPLVDVSDTGVYFDFSTGGSAASFNGFQLIDYTNTIDPFTSVTIAGTNLAFGPSRLTYDANNIWVNFQGLASGSNGFVSLNVASTAVPEPGVLALFGLGLAGFAFSRGRRV